MYAFEMVEISPGATVQCGMVYVPVARDEICFVNAKAGLGLLYNFFEQSNQYGVINSLSIVNKTEFHITIQHRQQVRSLHLMETVNIPRNILNSFFLLL